MDTSSQVLAELLMKLIQGEHEVEYCRKSLADLYSFNPYSVFSLLAKVYRTALTPRDLQDFLRESSQEAAEEDIYLLVRQYSAEQNGRLTYDDFSHLVLPATNELILKIASSRLFINEIDSKVRFSLANLLLTELKLQRELDELKVQLFKSNGFSLWKSFELINASGSGYINEEEVKVFLKGFKKIISSIDYDALMRRIDLEDDLVINYNEFLEGLIPMQMPGSSEQVLEKREETEELLETNGKLQSLDCEEQVLDKPLDSAELSPKFNDPKEFTLSGDFETPEKSKGLPKVNKKLQEIQEKLILILKLELQAEKAYEPLKESVVMQTSFSAKTLFELIDSEGTGEVSMFDFENFLKSLNLSPSKEVIVSLFDRVSSESVLSLDSLAFLFQSQDNEYNEVLFNSDSGESFSSATLGLISEYFAVLLEREREILKEKSYFLDVEVKEIRHLFEFVDIDGDGILGLSDLKKLLLTAGLNVSQKDLTMLKLRYPEITAEVFESVLRVKELDI